MKKKKNIVTCDLGFKLDEPFARKVDALAKSGVKYFRKSIMTTPEIEQNKRTEISIIATSDLDRDFEIVDPLLSKDGGPGIDDSDYRKNPIILMNHDYDQIVGKNMWIKNSNGNLIAKSHYTVRPKNFEGDWLPDFCWEMICADVLRGKSIGFMALDYRDPTREEQEKYPRIDRIISKCLLTEYSAVAVPSNQNALLQSIEKGLYLNFWKIKKIGMVKKFRPKIVTSQERFIKDVKNLEIDIDKIVKQVEKSLFERWEI